MPLSHTVWGECLYQLTNLTFFSEIHKNRAIVMDKYTAIYRKDKEKNENAGITVQKC